MIDIGKIFTCSSRGCGHFGSAVEGVVLSADDPAQHDYTNARFWNRPRRLRPGIDLSAQVVCAGCKQKALALNKDAQFHPLHKTITILNDLEQGEKLLVDLMNQPRRPNNPMANLADLMKVK